MNILVVSCKEKQQEHTFCHHSKQRIVKGALGKHSTIKNIAIAQGSDGHIMDKTSSCVQESKMGDANEDLPIELEAENSNQVAVYHVREACEVFTLRSLAFAPSIEAKVLLQHQRMGHPTLDNMIESVKLHHSRFQLCNEEELLSYKKLFGRIRCHGCFSSKISKNLPHHHGEAEFREGPFEVGELWFLDLVKLPCKSVLGNVYEIFSSNIRHPVVQFNF